MRPIGDPLDRAEDPGIIACGYPLSAPRGGGRLCPTEKLLADRRRGKRGACGHHESTHRLSEDSEAECTNIPRRQAQRQKSCLTVSGATCGPANPLGSTPVTRMSFLAGGLHPRPLAVLRPR